MIHAKFDPKSPWVPATLSTERVPNHFDLPLAVVDEQGRAHNPLEVYRIQGLRETNEEMLEQARQAGYRVLR